MDLLKSKIEGSLYGFIIGDSMGATTSYLQKEMIKIKYGKVTSLIGGGWLGLKRGEITYDAQMTVYVMKALMDTLERGHSTYEGWYFFTEYLKQYFTEWYDSFPEGTDSACRRGIQKLIEGTNPLNRKLYDKSALGNGSLMRALPIALIGPEYENWNTLQGRFTHNNGRCSRIILDYSRLIWNLIHCIPYSPRESLSRRILEPLGTSTNTYNNSLYWSLKDTFEEAVIGAVNNGGSANTIAAITGSIAGARFGIENIPKKWINLLDPEIKHFLNRFVNFLVKYVQNDVLVI